MPPMAASGHCAAAAAAHRRLLPSLRCSAAQADSGAPTIFDKIISKEIPAQVGLGCH